jgi:glutaredoxin
MADKAAEPTGCELAGALLNFDAIYINYLGVFAALTLLILGLLTYKKKIPQLLFFVVLVASLLFETVMLGYQYFASPKMCAFCMGVYGFLVVILLLTARRYALAVIPSVIAVLMALSFLAIPASKTFIEKDGTYLIQSPTCPHCKKVKKYMHENNIDFTKIDIAEIEAQHFATFLNFKSIPILVIKEGKNVKIINGDRNIIDSYEKIDSDEIQIEESVSLDTTFNAVEEEGCGFGNLNTITAQEAPCDSPK